MELKNSCYLVNFIAIICRDTMYYTNTYHCVVNAVQVCSLRAIEKQNLSPQSISIWHNYFRLVNFKKEQTWKKL